MPTIHGTVIIRGVELDVISDCEVRWVDDSFDHEFGTEVCGHAEVECVDSVELDGDLRWYALLELEDKGRPHCRRRFIKWLRRIRREVAALDPDSFWTKDQLEAAVEHWEPPEPDYDA